MWLLAICRDGGGVELTVLGCGGGVPRPGDATCGHLLTHGDTKVWVDAGNGTLGQSMRHAQIGEIDAVVISHRQWVNSIDLYPFALGRQGVDSAKRHSPPFRLIAPLDLLPHIEQLVGDAGAFDDDIVWEPLEPGQATTIGDISLETRPMTHLVPTLGMRFSAGGRTIAYSADTGPCEAMYGAEQPGEPVHLTARQAGEHAERAGAQSLVLTHLWYEHDLEAACLAARAAYTGPVRPQRTTCCGSR